MGTSASWAQALSQDEEYRVKAAFVYHFAQLISWPSDATGNIDRQLLLCTFGEDPFHGKLEDIVAGKMVGSLRVHIRHLKQVTPELRICQILFIGRNESNHFTSLLSELHNAPVLTVGESDAFLSEGGVISFILRNGKIRFAINLDAADRRRLKVSSRLLLLAEQVTGDSSGRQ